LNLLYENLLFSNLYHPQKKVSKLVTFAPSPFLYTDGYKGLHPEIALITTRTIAITGRTGMNPPIVQPHANSDIQRITR
jgi:hypothetical protein